MDVAFFIGGIFFIIALWLSLDFQLGRSLHLNKVHIQTISMRHSNFELFTDGNELFTDFFRELKEAKESIHVLFYIVKGDKISTEFLTILKEKAKAGIEVRLLVDWIGSFSIPRKKVKELAAVGVQFSFCHLPKLPFLFYSIQVRNHRKMSIIDGKIGYLGGFNVGKEYVDQDPVLNPWRDFHVKITGEGVYDLQEAFLHDWQKEAKTTISDLKRYFPCLDKGKSRHEIIPTEGVFLEQSFSSLIRSAKHSIIICSPYFIPSQQLQHDLLQAINNGVQVTILVPEKQDQMLVKAASYRYFRDLLQSGAKVFQYLNGFYHGKVILIDHSICEIGTANFDKRSLFLNREINCYIYHDSFIQQVHAALRSDLQDSKPLTLQELNAPHLLRTVQEGIANIFSTFL